MGTSLQRKLIELAQSLPPSTDRAQAYRLAQLYCNTVSPMADIILSDHANESHAKRYAWMLVKVGAATEIKNGHFQSTYEFIDGSIL